MHLHLLTEDDLNTREIERDLYRNLAEAQRQRELKAVVGRVPLRLVEAEELDALRALRHEGAQMACTAGGTPTVPTRRNRRLPRLSIWRRLALAWTRVCASIQRSAL